MSSYMERFLCTLQYRDLRVLFDLFLKTTPYRTYHPKRNQVDYFLRMAKIANVDLKEVEVAAHLIAVQNVRIKAISVICEIKSRSDMDKAKRDELKRKLASCPSGQVLSFDNTMTFDFDGEYRSSEQVMSSFPYLEFVVVQPGQVQPFQSPLFRLSTVLWHFVPFHVSLDTIQKLSEGDWELRPRRGGNSWANRYFEKSRQVCLVHRQHDFILYQNRSLPRIYNESCKKEKRMIKK